VNPLDPSTLKHIADMICGTDGSGPKYREYWELEAFFANAGWTEVPPYAGGPGYGRGRWTRDLLLDRRNDTEAIAQVIRRLADPREYPKAPHLASVAADELNKLLDGEGLRIDHVRGRPELTEVEPSLSPAAKMEPAVLKTDIADVVRDPKLAELLRQRLDEAQACRASGAHLSAVIMLGSVLEGVLFDVARNNMSQACQSSPVPKRDGRPLPVEDWKLTSLIEVAHDCGWIELDIRKFSHELRDYRNMVHATGELKHGHHPNEGTVAICWEVVVAALNDLAP
jgi:hypothetical protein